MDTKGLSWWTSLSSPFRLRDRTFWLAVVKGLAILLLINTVVTAILALLGYRPPTNAFVGASFLEAAALLIIGASFGLYREQHLPQALQMVFLGVLLFLVSGAVQWVGFWVGV